LMTVWGHEERFPPIRLSAGCGFRKWRRSPECAATGEMRRFRPFPEAGSDRRVRPKAAVRRPIRLSPVVAQLKHATSWKQPHRHSCDAECQTIRWQTGLCVRQDRAHMPPRFAARKRSVSGRILTVDSRASTGLALNDDHYEVQRQPVKGPKAPVLQCAPGGCGYSNIGGLRFSIGLRLESARRQPVRKPCQKGRPSTARNQKGERRIARGSSLYPRA